MEETKTGHDLPPCEIFIDKEGEWFHQGAPIIHNGIIELFSANMEQDGEGRYRINWQGKPCLVEVEDTPFVVKRVEGHHGGLAIRLSDGSREELLFQSLTVGRENVLYCMVKNGRFSARFSRPAYYQLAEYLHEDGGSYCLVVGERKYPIATEQ